MSDRHDALSEDQANHLWARAAELQERARTDAVRLADETRAEFDDLRAVISADVAREAAVESGIDGRFVDQALRQVRMDGKLDTRASAARWARALGISDETLSERIHLDVSPSAAEAAVTSVVQATPFSLELLDVIDLDRNARACLYEVSENDDKSSPFRYHVRSVSDVRRVVIIVSRSPDDGADLELYCRLDNSVLVNGIAVRALQAVGAALGVGIGLALGALVIRLAGLEPTSMVSLLRGAFGVLAGIGAGVFAGHAFRGFYRHGLKRVRDSFRKLLVAVRMRAAPDRREGEPVSAGAVNPTPPDR